MGSSALITASMRELEQRSPEELKRMLRSDAWLELALSAFETRLRNAERDAVRIYFELYGAIEGEQSAALLAWLSSMGVKSAELARSMIELAKRAMDSSDTDAYKLARELVRARVVADPIERRRVEQEVLGIMSAPSAVTAADTLRSAARAACEAYFRPRSDAELAADVETRDHVIDSMQALREALEVAA